MQYCAQCGQPLTGEGRFCAQCGAAQASPAAAPAPASPVTTPPEQPQAFTPPPPAAAPPAQQWARPEYGPPAYGPPAGQPGYAGQAPAAPSRRPLAGLPTWALVTIVVAAVAAVALAVAFVVVLPRYYDQRSQSRATAVESGVRAIQVGIRSFAVANGDSYPTPGTVTQYGLQSYVGTWPENPYTGVPMKQGTGPGDFQYTVSPGFKSFSLTGYGEKGEVLVTLQ